MRKVALAWLALLAWPFAVAAQADIDAYLAMMDGNHDGRVALAEYLDYMGAGFRRMDGNGDGVLDAGELPSSPRHHGPLTLARHRQNLTAAFHRQDANKDGYLDARELAAPPR